MVAPNGARLLKDEHNALPLSINEIVETSKNCESAGANAIHLHVRDNNLKHTLSVSKYKQSIEAIKKECSKDFIIQATTESVGMYEPDEMISVIKELRPQATSVAIKEILPLFDDKKQLKQAKDFYTFAQDENIGVQHILYSLDDLKRFNKLLEQEIIRSSKHSMLFVLGRYSKNQESKISEIIPLLQELKNLNLEDKVHWMLCAFGKMQIPSLVATSLLQGHARIGFENSRLLPNSKQALNNEEQVRYLRNQLEALNIQKTKYQESKEILGIFK